MLDKSILYYDVIMKRERGEIIPNQLLPHGFRFSFLKLGDEKVGLKLKLLLANLMIEIGH